jgi:hypothetical protein
MAEATVVSIVPFPISEAKPGIYPGYFNLPASKDEEPVVLAIGNSKCYIPRLEGQKPIEARLPAEEIAAAIVNDFIHAHLGTDEGAHPGLFWLEGNVSSTDVLVKHAEKLAAASQAQKNWFVNLVKIADDDWVKGNKKHIFISDIQRIAAKSLGLEREWIIKIPEKVIKLMACPACTTQINSEAVICPSCRAVINAKKYKELQFAGA